MVKNCVTFVATFAAAVFSFPPVIYADKHFLAIFFMRNVLEFQISRSQRLLRSYILFVILTSEIRLLQIAFVSVSTYEISLIIGNSSQLSFKR